MGVVVQLNDYRNNTADIDDAVADSYVPIEFAVGLSDREKCLQKIADHGIESIQIRRLKNEPDSLIYLLSVKDALWLNKKILEREELSDDDIEKRIDIIQMLENLDLNLLENLWSAFTNQQDLSDSVF